MIYKNICLDRHLCGFTTWKKWISLNTHAWPLCLTTFVNCGQTDYLVTILPVGIDHSIYCLQVSKFLAKKKQKSIDMGNTIVSMDRTCVAFSLFKHCFKFRRQKLAVCKSVWYVCQGAFRMGSMIGLWLVLISPYREERSQTTVWDTPKNDKKWTKWATANHCRVTEWTGRGYLTMQIGICKEIQAVWPDDCKAFQMPLLGIRPRPQGWEAMALRHWSIQTVSQSLFLFWSL